VPISRETCEKAQREERKKMSVGRKEKLIMSGEGIARALFGEVVERYRVKGRTVSLGCRGFVRGCLGSKRGVWAS